MLKSRDRFWSQFLMVLVSVMRDVASGLGLKDSGVSLEGCGLGQMY